VTMSGEAKTCAGQTGDSRSEASTRLRENEFPSVAREQREVIDRGIYAWTVTSLPHARGQINFGVNLPGDHLEAGP